MTPPNILQAICLIFLSVSACAKHGTDELQPVQAAKQMVLVTTDNWEATRGTLTRWERPNTSAAWTLVGGKVQIAVGRHGLAWGRGLHTGRVRAGPVKVEGDGHAPAGVFRLRASFGHAKSPPLTFPYIELTDKVICVNDVASRRYNRIVSIDHVVDPDWQSSTQMFVEQHTWGVVIDHNVGDQFAKGSGSCCFLTVGTAPTETSTAVPSPAMKTVVEWLDPAALPVLVQLPVAQHRRLGRSWNLPGR